ncbi:MAG TPA: peptide chain release factor 1 [Planctomycetota bacterium]|nr:peptide chain release factor 1 [Planctomycetota bacterium]
MSQNEGSAHPAPLEPVIRRALDEMSVRHETLEREMSSPETASNPAKLRALSKEYGTLGKTLGSYRKLAKLWREKAEAEQMLEGETDVEMQTLAREEIEKLASREAVLVDEVRRRFVLDDADASRNVIMEIRAGTGGDEAALFAADLFGMYRRFAESKGWRVELMSSSPTELGGFRDVTLGISGDEVHRQLRYESGGHRVQRVPETETQGRIHTSACTVAVLPEVEEVEVDIKDEEIEIDRYHSSGPGGQNVNKTSSAIRIHHKPSGLIVQCQDEKSQRKNLARAMRILRSRLYDMEEERRRSERDAARRTLIGSGDRSQRIRTYNFPQNRVTDHRINLTLYNLDRVILGAMDHVIDALMEYDRQERLKALAKKEI